MYSSLDYSEMIGEILLQVLKLEPTTRRPEIYLEWLKKTEVANL